MVVHPPGEVKASKALCSCPSNAPIRPIVAITQLPDLGSLDVMGFQAVYFFPYPEPVIVFEGAT
jgi:hypothetical protein